MDTMDIIVILIYGIIIGLLWILNLKKEDRYKQFWYPYAVVVFSFPVIVIYSFVQDIVDKINGWLSYLLHYNPSPPFPVFFNLAVMLVFLIIKVSLYFWIKRKDRLLNEGDDKEWTASSMRDGGGGHLSQEAEGGKKAGDVMADKTAAMQPVSKASFAYQLSDSHDVVLKNEWVFPRDFLFGLSLCVALPLLLFSLMTSMLKLPISVPYLPSLSFLLLLEVVWYLGGNRIFKDKIEGESASITHALFSDLWEFYQRIWPNRVLLAGWFEPAEKSDQSEIIGDIAARLKQKNQLLIHGTDYTELMPELFQFLREIIIGGGRILFVVGDTKEITSSHFHSFMDKIHKDDDFGEILIDDLSALGRSQSPDILVATPDELSWERIERAKNNWFEKLDVVLIPDVSPMSTYLQPLGGFFQALRSCWDRPLQFIILSDIAEFRFDEDSFKDAFSIKDLQSISLKNSLAPECKVIVWRREGLDDNEKWFQNALFPRHSEKYLGAESVLSLPAWLYKKIPVRMANQKNLPWQERAEALQEHINKDYLDQNFCSKDGLPGQTGNPDVLDYQPVAWRHLAGSEDVVIVPDEDCNLTAPMVKYLSKVKRAALVHVVSPPYMLRNYLAANIEYFQKHPLQPLVPRMSDAPSANAIDLLCRLAATQTDEDTVMRSLKKYDEHINDAYEGLKKIFYHIDINQLDSFLLKESKDVFRVDDSDVHQGCFHEVTYYQFSTDIWKIQHLCDLTTRYTILNPAIEKSEGGILGHVRGEHVYQNYMPHQFHSFEGSSYEITNIISDKGEIHVRPQAMQDDYIYRPLAYVEFADDVTDFNNNNVMHSNVHEYPFYKKWHVCRKIMEVDLSIKIKGFLQFKNRLAVTPNDYERIGIDTIPDRRYLHGRVLGLYFTPRNQEFLCSLKISYTLGALMNEILRSVFPKTCQYVMAGSLIENPPSGSDRQPNDANHAENISIVNLFPKLILAKGKTGIKNNCITLLFVEDSFSDMGLVQVISDQWLYLLEILYDYLTWCLDGKIGNKEGKDQQEWRKNLIGDPKDFLRFGLQEIPEEFDIEGLKQFLDNLGFGAANTIGGKRRDFYAGEADWSHLSPQPQIVTQQITKDGKTLIHGQTSKEIHFCDFCGGQYPVSQLERFEESGMERCEKCKEQAIESLDKLIDVLNEARDFLEKDMNALIRSSTSVRFENAMRIAERTGRTLIPTPRHDNRIIGLAISGENVICIEHGAPYFTILSTLVHELTHIWQYENLDMDALHAQDNSQYYIEGLATWAEVECLRRKNMAKEYIETQLVPENRRDEYATGYRMVEQFNKEMNRKGTPFDYFLGLYKKK